MSERPTFTTNDYEPASRESPVLPEVADRNELSNAAREQVSRSVGAKALGAVVEYKPRHAKPEEISNVEQPAPEPEATGDTRELPPPEMRENMATLRKIQRQVMDFRGNPLSKLPPQQALAMQRQLDMVLGSLHRGDPGDLTTAKRALGFMPGATAVNEIQARMRSAVADLDSKYKF